MAIDTALDIAFIDHLYLSLLTSASLSEWKSPFPSVMDLHENPSTLVAEYMGREFLKLDYNKMNLSDESKLFAKDFLSDIEKFMMYISYCKKDDISNVLKKLKALRKYFLENPTKIIALAMELVKQSSLLMDNTLALIRWITMQDTFESIRGSTV